MADRDDQEFEARSGDPVGGRSDAAITLNPLSPDGQLPPEQVRSLGGEADCPTDLERARTRPLPEEFDMHD